jgi:GrpB-like predicted nucleotidyltransferase (UPF0157 family)
MIVEPMAEQAPIHIVPYDETWPAQFEVEQALLAGLLQPWLLGTIEHVGSTAVPGLCAKPVIDVMVGVRSLADSIPGRDALVAAGYQYAAYKTDVMHWLCKPCFAVRTHHVHLVPHGSPLWHERLAFRDLLRRDREVADAYARLKTGLAERFEFDREAYTELKGPFIRQMLASRA